MRSNSIARCIQTRSGRCGEQPNRSNAGDNNQRQHHGVLNGCRSALVEDEAFKFFDVAHLIQAPFDLSPD
jgi:hypothetical protein